MPSSRTNVTIRLTDERREKLSLRAQLLGISKAALLEQWCNEHLDEIKLPKRPATSKSPVPAPGKPRARAVKDDGTKVTAAHKGR